MWVADHQLVRDDPHIVPRLRDFLRLINAPSSLVVIAKNLLLKLDRKVRVIHLILAWPELTV